MRYSLRVFLPWMVIVLMALGLSGCGETAATQSTQSTPAADMTLKVGQISNSIAFFPFYVADKQGFFKQQKLNIGPRPLLGTGAKVAAALRAGSIQVGGGVITDALNLQKVDPTAKVIGSLVNSDYIDIIGSTKFDQAAHVTASSSLADRIMALRGKKVGITGPGSGTEALVTYLFKMEGLDPKKDVVLVNLGSDNTAALSALSTNRVDALSFFAPVGQAAEVKGFGSILISPNRGDIPAIDGMLNGIFYTRQSVIQAHPQEIKAFIKAIAQAEAYIQSNPTQAQALLNSYVQMGQPVTQSTWTAFKPVIAHTPEITQDTYNKAVQFHLKAGLLKVAPDYNTLIATSTIASALSDK